MILAVIMMTFFGGTLSMDLRLWNKWSYDTSLTDDYGLRNNLHRNADGAHIVDIRKTWEKLQLSAREMAAPEFEQMIAVFREMNEKSMRKAALLKLKEEIDYQEPKKHVFSLPREKEALHHKKRLPAFLLRVKLRRTRRS